MLKYVALLLLAAVLAQKASAQEQIPVTLYYEALCPDSIKFFTKQLYPTLQRGVAKNIKLELIPYGRASQTRNETAGVWDFTCHHGPNECYANKIQACAISKIEGGRPSPNLGYNKITLAFINCLMDKVVINPFHLPIDDCATQSNVNNRAEIENCANHTDGSDLLAQLGDLTKVLSPKLSFVPTVTFKKTYKKADNDMSQVNFQNVLCSYITDKKAAECQTSGSNVVVNSFITTLVTVSLLASVKHLF